jgi:sugar lactone lactonase YvrE
MNWSRWIGLAVIGLAVFGARQVRADLLYVSSYNSGGHNGTIVTIPPGAPPFASGLNGPYGMAFDSAGNLYVAIVGDNTIDKITPGGMVSVFASTGLNEPVGLVFDKSGNLYVSNAAGTTIEKFTPLGVNTTFASNIPYGYSLAIDSGGNIYVDEANNGTIEKFTPGGVGSVFASGLGQNLLGLAIDKSDNVYASGDFPKIKKFTPGGVESDFATVPSQDTWALAFDSSGHLFALNYGLGTVTKFNSAGVGSPFASGLDHPTGLVLAPTPGVPGVPEPSSLVVACGGLGLIGAFVSYRNRHRRGGNAG